MSVWKDRNSAASSERVSDAQGGFSLWRIIHPLYHILNVAMTTSDGGRGWPSPRTVAKVFEKDLSAITTFSLIFTLPIFTC